MYNTLRDANDEDEHERSSIFTITKVKMLKKGNEDSDQFLAQRQALIRDNFPCIVGWQWKQTLQRYIHLSG